MLSMIFIILFIYLFIIIIIIIIIIIVIIIIGFYPVSVLVTNVCSLSTFSKLCQPLKGQLRKTADKNVSQTVLVKEWVVPPLHDGQL